MTQITPMFAVLSVACGILCYYFAKNKGLKYPLAWGLAGVIGSVFVLLLVGFIKNKVDEKKSAKNKYADDEDDDSLN